MQKRRPLAPLIAGCFLLLAALICLATSATLLAPGSILDGMWAIKPDAYRQLKALAPWSGIGFISLAAVMSTASYGAFARTTWSWRLIVVMATVNGAGDAAQLAFGRWLEGTIGVLAALLILYALTRPRIKKSFRK